jgi:hypothetical protein
MARLKFRFILGAARSLTPWVLRASVTALRLALETIVDWWRGVPTILTRFADLWLDRVGGRIPSAYLKYFYYAVCVISLFMIILGWIVASYVTVGIIEFLIQ